MQKNLEIYLGDTKEINYFEKRMRYDSVYENMRKDIETYIKQENL